MQGHAGGYVVPGGLQAGRWDEGADPSLRGIALIVAVTLGLIGAFSAVSYTSPGHAARPSTPHATVVGSALVDNTKATPPG